MTEKKKWVNEYLARLRPSLEGKAEGKVPMKHYTTFRIGGFADVMVWPRSLEELEATIRAAEEMEAEWEVVGAGSNLLVGDGGLQMVVINMGEISKDINRSEEEAAGTDCESPVISLDAGLKLPFAAKQCRDAGLSGFEFAAGIPGSVGGAVIMNAGSMGACMGDVLEWVEWYKPGKGVQRKFRNDLEYDYRRLSHPPDAIVTACGIALQKDDPRSIRENIVKGLKWRRQNQPLSCPSAGSVFKNPPGDYAGRLIEEAGMKGAREGDAQVSELHANFIINRGRARSRDVLALIDRVRDEVEKAFKLSLELEIKVIGKEIS